MALESGWDRSHKTVPWESPKATAGRSARSNKSRTFTVATRLSSRRGSGRRSPQSTVIVWLVDYIGVLLSMYHVNDDGTTAVEQMHGKRADEKLACFGEKVLFNVPKRRRSKLDLRWPSGVCLGTLMNTKEPLIGLPNGDVSRSSRIARVRCDQRWVAEPLERITGIP